MLAHPRRGGTAWVVPLVADSQRVPPDGHLAVHRTDDAGVSWTRQDGGLPDQEWNVVLRGAATVDTAEPAGVYVVRGDSVTWRPAVDAGRIALTLGLALCGAAALVGWAAVTRRS